MQGGTWQSEFITETQQNLSIQKHLQELHLNSLTAFSPSHSHSISLKKSHQMHYSSLSIFQKEKLQKASLPLRVIKIFQSPDAFCLPLCLSTFRSLSFNFSDRWMECLVKVEPSKWVRFNMGPPGTTQLVRADCSFCIICSIDSVRQITIGCFVLIAPSDSYRQMQQQGD